MSRKKPLVVIYKVSRLFFNTLTADYQYSLLSEDNSMQTIQMHLSKKQKTFLQFFFAFFKSTLKFEHFAKKMTLIAYEFRNYRPRKTWLDKCLKNPVKDDPSTGNMVNGPNY